MEQTMCWFGFNDLVLQQDIRQLGTAKFVDALHHTPNSQTWTIEETLIQKKINEDNGLIRSTVNSIHVRPDYGSSNDRWLNQKTTPVYSDNNNCLLGLAEFQGIEYTFHQSFYEQ